MTEKDMLRALMIAVGDLHERITGEKLIIDVPVEAGNLRLQLGGPSRPSRSASGSSAQAERASSRAPA